MDQMYAAREYHRLSRLDLRNTSGRQKVVVYARTQNGRIIQVTHAPVPNATASGRASSGKLSRIRHLTADALEGPEYGVPVAVYERPRPAAER